MNLPAGFAGEFRIRQRVAHRQFRLGDVPAGRAGHAEFSGALNVFNPVVIRRDHEREP